MFVYMRQSLVCSEAETKMSLEKERLKWKVVRGGNGAGRGGVAEEAGWRAGILGAPGAVRRL